MRNEMEYSLFDVIGCKPTELKTKFKNKYMNAIETLSKYGTVRTCKIIKEQVVTIVLTDGFTENAMKTFEFLGKCQELFPDYPKMETCVTEKNCAIVVLTK